MRAGGEESGGEGEGVGEEQRFFFFLLNLHVDPLMTHGVQSLSTWALHHQLTGDLTARLTNV